MHAMLLQHLVGELFADVGLDLVVTVHDLHVEPADLAPEVIERQLDGALHVLADGPLRAGQRGDEANLHGLGRGRGGGESREQPDENGAGDRVHG